ncbi:MAG: OmpA family protein [Saprospiraceae bacterium]|nr:OmpA family protein [Saprospiraceae bacterium]
MRKILLVLATVAWVLFWWWWYTCKICETCLCYQAAAPITQTLPKETGAILFNLNDSDALTQYGWPRYRDSLIDQLNQFQRLEIEGQYLDEESNTTGFENLGLARASAIRKLFPDSLFNRINLTGLKIDKRPGMDQNPFLASAFYLRPGSENVIETGDKTIIYFKSNSSQRLQDKEMESFLDQLALKHGADRSVFNITGFTDNTGTPKQNLKMGLTRANTIKNYLIGKGIPADRINVFSKGEADPIANNATAVGQQKNRRIEIEIIQKL